MALDTRLESKYVTSPGGLRVRYLEAGSGRPLVLIHGLTLHEPCQQWLPFFDDLAADAHVYAMDLPGWGMSDMPLEGYSFPMWIDAVAGLVDGLGLEQVDIMAYSFGAWIATLYASENPQRVRRLVSLHNPGLNAIVSEYHPAEDFQLPPRETVRRSYPTQELADWVYEELDRPGRAAAHEAVLRYIGDPAVRQEWSLRPRLPSMDMPILSADRDSGFVHGTVELVELAPVARLLITPSRSFPQLVAAGKAFLQQEEVQPLGKLR